MMGDNRNDIDGDGIDDLDLREEDRLPWLEAVEDVNRDDSVAPGKLIGGVVAALAALGLVIGGVYWWKNRHAPEGDGTTIAAPEGDYKEKPVDAGGMNVAGDGDTTFAASEGAGANGAIDANAVTEVPVQGTRVPATTSAAPTGREVSATVAGAKPGTLAPTRTAVAGPAVKSQGGAASSAPQGAGPLQSAASAASAVAPGQAGSMIQLGAFGTQAKAEQVWAGLTKRFGYLASVPKMIVPVNGANGTVYRLRGNAGSAANAAALCSKLKAAGETCIIA